MRLVANDMGQIVYLVPIEELRPLSGVSNATLINEITAKYRFDVFPANLAEIEKASGYKFASGQVSTLAGEIQVAKLELFQDGVLIQTRDTESCELVLNDFLEWSKEKFRLRAATSRPTIRYFSSVVVEFDRSIEKFFSQFELLRAAYSKAFRDSTGRAIEVTDIRYAMSADPSVLPPNINTTFLLERRNGSPFTSNRYFSSAPLKNKDLLAILTMLDA
jgi:hypothetical protein